MRTYAYGYPRIGANREYKKSVESFFTGTISEAQLRAALDELQRAILTTYDGRIDSFPVGEMTRYDAMLDTAIVFGIYRPENTTQYYELCRGADALPMTKWFNTNYHYLMPDLSGIEPDELSVHWNKPKETAMEFGLGIPSIIGPVTFLRLSRGVSPERFEPMLMALARNYRKMLSSLSEIHIDEPAFVLDTDKKTVSLIKKAYDIIGDTSCRINMMTYYEGVDFLPDLYDLPISALGLDFVHGKSNLRQIRKHGFPSDKMLIAGVVDGRNVWRSDIGAKMNLLDELYEHVQHLSVSNAAPLYHLPVTTAGENLPPQLLDKLAFADQRLEELETIATLHDESNEPESSTSSAYGLNKDVQKRIQSLTDADFNRSVPYPKRVERQKRVLNLPPFPTTTIGSFPQTADIRRKRAAFRRGDVSGKEYKSFINNKIDQLISFQKEVGLDVFVHGEYERTDMVEYFAEKLQGVATTSKGWILSYGTRGYRPPIVYGDVYRSEPMTLREIDYAQKHSPKPVKGMLTGPATIISWSFVREDVSQEQVAYQIALGLKDEIRDYEQAGIRIVQVDEPAFREHAPIKKRDWGKYFTWAVRAFNLATSVSPETQIHTHMCYSSFGEIIEQIARMDFDVISIEASRSDVAILKDFADISFDRQIGLGVWDIHSPSVPSSAHMEKVVRNALEVFDKSQIWVNPDCGLKTRDWEETRESLRAMVLAARSLRDDLA
ncbi:MAG: 5-methyltetrahydropteroyltriglutamate--homocysteine S-methyltransferase [Chitinivibrionales bacterium]